MSPFFFYFYLLIFYFLKWLSSKLLHTAKQMAETTEQ